MSFVEKEIERLRRKKDNEGLSEGEYESLMEYEGRISAINWERDYLNGEDR